MKKILVIGLVTLLFASCSQKDILSGEITDKTYTKAHTEIYTSVTKVGNVMLPQTKTLYRSATWTVTIYDTIEDKWSSSYVNEELYNQIEIGDSVTRIDGTITKVN